MRINGTLFVSAGLCLVALQWGRGQSNDVSKTGTDAATFLEIPVGATAVGMGGAFVSYANDATSLYWNPSACALLTQNNFTVSHTNWIADTKFDFGGVVIPLGGFGVLGLGITSLSMADMKVRTVEQPEGTGEYFSAGDIAAGLSYARQLTDRFAIGFTAKYIQESIWHESANAFALDAGTTFKTDLFGGLTIGATISNFGTKMQMAGRDTRQFIRIDPTKQGSNDQIPTDVEMDSWDLPLLFQFGISTNVLKMENYRWTVAADALHPSDDFESVNIGTEFSYHDVLFLRGGYQSLFLDQHEGGLSLGVGVLSSSIMNGLAVKIDYAYRDMGRLEGVHVFSVCVQF
ncbi:MAG: PorV/PorQ family protein [Bacteroidota bacterium]|jgi:hypothetical protein